MTTIIEKFERRLGSADFVSPADLVKSGIFGSLSAVRSALQKKLFPYVRVSASRILIDREGILNYLRSNTQG